MEIYNPENIPIDELPPAKNYEIVHKCEAGKYDNIYKVGGYWYTSDLLIYYCPFCGQKLD